MSKRLPLIALVAGSLLLSGCGRALCRREPPTRGYGNNPPAYTLPPQNIPDGPPPIAPVPRAGGTGGAELLLPESMSPGAKTRSEYFDPSNMAPHAPPPKPSAPVNPEPPVSKSVPPPSSAAIGIASFARVKEGVNTGLRPEIEGLDWLQSKGHKTVIYLRTPSDDGLTDMRQTEKREMKFVSFEITPEGINKFFVDEFNQVIGDSAKRPMFVYARDANMSAAIWYLHLRTAEFLTHEEALARATQLGLTNEKNEYFLAAVKAATN